MSRAPRYTSVGAALGLALLLSPSAVRAGTTGTITGRVTDKATGEGVPGVTIVATSSALQGEQAELSDGTGAYTITGLAPGEYALRFYFDDVTVERGGIAIAADKTIKINVAMSTGAARAETYTIMERAPSVDQGQTRTGVVIDKEFHKNVPTGRTYEGVLAVAPGAVADDLGISFSGATSLENQYVIDGLNTSDVAFGHVATRLNLDFLEEVEVITGGYNAEFGRATGGIVNVVTKQGSNALHGSVFTNFRPFELDPKNAVTIGSGLDSQAELDFDVDFGFELGGPIIKDKLWFYVGFSPNIRKSTIRRTLSTFVDGDQDGAADLVPGSGVEQRQEVAAQELPTTSVEYQWTSKLNYSITPDHDVALSWYGNPSTWTGAGFNALDPLGLNRTTTLGPPSARDYEETLGSQDVAFRSLSKFFDRKWQVETNFGFHHQTDRPNPTTEAGLDRQLAHFEVQPITAFAADEGPLPAACTDGDVGSSDPFPLITNCPVQFYRQGGVGFESDLSLNRVAGKVASTHFLAGLGHHQVKYGLDFELNRFRDTRFYTGGQFALITEDGGFLDTQEFFSGFDADGNPQVVSELTAKTQTTNSGAFLQDSWSLLPNLTLNAGVRWEQQTLRGEGDVVALEIDDNIAPRVGLIYDWTQQGRSKLFAHWGRFYESIPLDLNDRGFGNEGILIEEYDRSVCPDPNSKVGCEAGQVFTFPLGGTFSLVQPGLKGQFSDELVVGSEYEVLPDLVVGANYINRRLGRVIEDISPDGGLTYLFANPGETVDQSILDDLDAKIANTDDEAEKANLQAIRDVLPLVNQFPKPERTYNAVQLTGRKRFTKSFALLTSYTLSRAEGNYPGLYQDSNGQFDPNLTTQFDLVELLSNHVGPLPNDRTHVVKVDGWYSWDLARLFGADAGVLVTGLSFFASSGKPVEVLGRHPVYGTDESFILPRGAGGRTPGRTQLDLNLKYGRALGKGMSLEAFATIFNLLNQRETLDVDQSFTFDAVNPIVGGDQEDLEHLKTADGSPATLNKNYKNAIDFQNPLTARFGLRLVF